MAPDLSPSLSHSLLQHLENLLDVPHLRSSPVSGGCIHQSYRLDAPSGSFFLKINTPNHLDSLETEAQGLEEILHTQTIRCPKPHATGIHAHHAWLLMEFIPFENSPPHFEQDFGIAMARLHQTHPPTFSPPRRSLVR